MQLQSKQYKYFYVSLLISIFFALITGIFILVYGKLDSFLLINSHHNSFWDFFFTYFTHFGDGVIWVPLVLYCILLEKEFLIPVFTGIFICTFLTHLLKRVVYPEELRPINLLTLNFPIHTIPGVVMNHIHSFPSGHTSTAFTLALLLTFMLNKKWLSLLLPLLAFVVGYSRIYQAQHFVTDVWAGIMIGIISACLSFLFYKKFRKEKT